MGGIGDDFMAVVSAILIVLTFIVNFILDFPFFWIGYQFAYYFMPAEKFLTGNDQVIFLTELTCLAILIPAIFSTFGFMQWIFVYSTGAHDAKGADYDRLYKILQDLCRRENTDPSRYSLYVNEDQTINAYALGDKHITVNRGTLNLMDDEEIEGILAHELGHLHHRHTFASLLCVGMNWFSRVICLIYRCANFFVWLIHWIPFLGWFASIIMILINWQHVIFSWVLKIPMDFITILGYRSQEYQADAYAYKLGLGPELIKGFEHLLKINGDNWFFLDWFVSDHPGTKKRIKRIEKMMEKDKQKIEVI